jgi:serine/threonine protein kinase
VSKEQFSERFQREARAVEAMNHPHICVLYDVGPNYLVMEYVEGKPLKGPLPQFPRLCWLFSRATHCNWLAVSLGRSRSRSAAAPSTPCSAASSSHARACR